MFSCKLKMHVIATSIQQLYFATSVNKNYVYITTNFTQKLQNAVL